MAKRSSDKWIPQSVCPAPQQAVSAFGQQQLNSIAKGLRSARMESVLLKILNLYCWETLLGEMPVKSHWWKYSCWWTFLHTASTWCSKVEFSSVTVKRYLYCFTQSKIWKSVTTGVTTEVIFLKSTIISFVFDTLLVRKEALHESIKSSRTGPWSGSSLPSKET